MCWKSIYGSQVFAGRSALSSYPYCSVFSVLCSVFCVLCSVCCCLCAVCWVLTCCVLYGLQIAQCERNTVQRWAEWRLMTRVGWSLREAPMVPLHYCAPTAQQHCALCWKYSFSHHWQGRIDFNTVNPSLSTVKDPDPLPVERLMMRECPYSTKTRAVLGNPSPPPSTPLTSGFTFAFFVIFVIRIYPSHFHPLLSISIYRHQ